ncbi:hypothetical protein BH23THE1_BH23THE1_18380 [soil metagenome]
MKELVVVLGGWGEEADKRWNQTKVSGTKNIEYCQGKIILNSLYF